MFPLAISKILYLIGVYFFCAIPFGVLISRCFAGKDVRKHGSGNTGATNVSRVMGKKWGILVLLLDALKGFLAVWYWRENPQFASLIAVVAVLAHCYPVYLKFKGGKGVATSLGVLAALDVRIFGYALFVFALAVLLSRRVSAASLTAVLSVPLFCLIFGSRLEIWSALTIAAIVWWKHQENLQRIFRGQEPRFF